MDATNQKRLVARQKSEIAHVVLMKGFRAHYWQFYTTSQGRFCQWDDRTFKTMDQAANAALEAGFTVRVHKEEHKAR